LRGAVAVLAEKKTNAPIPHIIVPTVREALGKWAGPVAVGAKPLRIGVTGSVGKTTVKDALLTMLSPHFKTHATYKNYNNDLGLPFTILSAPQNTEVLICEIGVSEQGEMAPLSAILRPHISIITCIGHAHIGAFGSREAIAKEKTDILKCASENGLLLVPAG
jgi:UDP-N-acetylmuramoyl-tripeptide--D-alanyl-D-alanine ligase